MTEFLARRKLLREFAAWLSRSGGKTRCSFPTYLSRCRANIAHTRQSRPASGLGFQVKVREAVFVVPFALGRGMRKWVAVLLVNVVALSFEQGRPN